MTTEPLFEGHTREIDTTSAHHIEWEFDRDSVIGKVVCTSGPDANCHQTADCDCESWYIERDETGVAYHLAGEEDLLGDEIQVRHYMRPRDVCNVSDWLGEGDLLESAVEGTSFVIARTPITPQWQDDHYLWELASSGES